MRTLLRLPLALAVSLGVVVAAAAPAAAGPLGTCPGGEPICVYIPAQPIPVTLPSGFGPISTPPTLVPLPRVCDSSGTNCVETYLIVPGLSASSTGGTLATVNFPGLGVGINGTTVTLYASPPTVTPGTLSLFTTVSVTASLFVVWHESFSLLCGAPVSQSVGPVTATGSPCLMTVTVTV